MPSAYMVDLSKTEKGVPWHHGIPLDPPLLISSSSSIYVAHTQKASLLGALLL